MGFLELATVQPRHIMPRKHWPRFDVFEHFVVIGGYEDRLDAVPVGKQRSDEI